MFIYFLIYLYLFLYLFVVSLLGVREQLLLLHGLLGSHQGVLQLARYHSAIYDYDEALQYLLLVIKIPFVCCFFWITNPSFF